MRHLIACSACRRQFDAGTLSVGATFACPCGATVAVSAPRSHDAAVVRCSACGAAREEGRPACGFCGGDFTLHEQDLHTICPACLARISDRARFCHHCGVAVTPQPASTATERRSCPACPDQALRHRALPEGPPLLECERCAGLWIEPHELRALLQRADTAAAPARELLGPAPPRAAPVPPVAAREAVVYLACPECGTRMNRKRFAGGAGVLVDYCRDHGLWFDAQEMERVLRAVADGHAGRRGASATALPGDPSRSPKQRRSDLDDLWRREGPLPRDPWGAGLIGEVLSALGRLLGR